MDNEKKVDREALFYKTLVFEHICKDAAMGQKIHTYIIMAQFANYTSGSSFFGP